MIYIDDAGSGSLIGGTVIGAMRKETKEYTYDIIPLEYYNYINFSKKLYLNKVVDITQDLFTKLDVNHDEPIYICRGYMFDKLRHWLKSEGYDYQSIKIADPLQSKIEKTFENYTIGLGFPKRYISYTKYPFHFHRILKWVYADYDNRVNLCKVGWKSWDKYGSLETTTENELVNKKNFICLKCNKKIKVNTEAKLIKFTSNKPQTIYLHHNC